MPPRTPLTTEQRTTVCHPSPRVLVVAPPGCGKTSIAAERFGLVRFNVSDDARRCVALSFTRAATRELQGRIRSRWGPSALAWPHQARTLDSFHVELVEALLRSGGVRWPTGAVVLTVEDSWRGFSGARYIPQGGWVPVPALKGGVVDVVSEKHQGAATTRVAKVSDLRAHFEVDRCTHVEIREILTLAVADADLRQVIGEQLSTTNRSFVVDEVFDANELDVAILELAAAGGAEIFAVGDPWQAVYEFRGADPRAVSNRLRSAGFDPVKGSDSFRFQTDEMKALVAALRSRGPSGVPPGGARTCDVVLGAEWEMLWGCDHEVLPLSFGIIRNQTDAAILLLLDEVVRRRLGLHAVYMDDAHAFLRTEDVDPGELRDAVVNFVELLAASAAADHGALLEVWRSTLRDLGVPVQLRRLKATKEREAAERLEAIASRLAASRSIPGMTVHQAKGGEWPTVGLRLTEDQAAALAAGLDPNLEEHRVLYVAATRAMQKVVSV